MGKGDTPEHLKLVDEIVEINKVECLTTKYPLNSDSIIYDVGAYTGKWALEMNNLYNCIIHSFEPIRSNLQNNIKNNANIIGHNFALGCCNGKRKIYLAKDASSFFVESNSFEEVYEKDIIQVMKDLKSYNISLLKLNIEGAEFDLLEHLIRHNMINKFDHIQVQYHGVVPNFDSRRLFIQKEFLKTHKKNYDYPFIWESWSKNK